MRKKETTEALGIAWVTIPYKGHRINVTCRDGGKDEAEMSLLAIIDILNENVIMDKEIDFVPVPDFTDVPLVKAPGDLGLLEYPPKAKERNSGDVYELTVNEYTNDGQKVQFYAGGEYPLHTHYLGEYGNKIMAEVFIPEWAERFPITAD